MVLRESGMTRCGVIDWWRWLHIGLGDLAGEDWGMGSEGRPNMSAKALHRSCIALVVVLPLPPVVAWWTICP